MPGWPRLWSCCSEDKEEGYVYLQKSVSAHQRMENYYQERNNKELIGNLGNNGNPTLKAVILQAKQERTAQAVVEKLLKSATLVFALNCELQQEKKLKAIAVQDPYQGLNLAPDASLDDIKKAYIKKARALDLVNIKQVNVAAFAKISIAYQALNSAKPEATVSRRRAG